MAKPESLHTSRPESLHTSSEVSAIIAKRLAKTREKHAAEVAALKRRIAELEGRLAMGLV